MLWQTDPKVHPFTLPIPLFSSPGVYRCLLPSSWVWEGPMTCLYLREYGKGDEISLTWVGYILTGVSLNRLHLDFPAGFMKWKVILEKNMCFFSWGFKRWLGTKCSLCQQPAKGQGSPSPSHKETHSTDNLHMPGCEFFPRWTSRRECSVVHALIIVLWGPEQWTQLGHHRHSTHVPWEIINTCCFKLPKLW